MINWFKYPFIRLLLPFVVGILLGYHLKIETLLGQFIQLALLIQLVLLVQLVLVSKLIKSYHFRWIFAVLLNLFFLISGFTMVKVRDISLNARHISQIDFISEYWVCRLSECPVEKEKSIKVILEVIGTKNDTSAFHKIDGKLMAYFEKDEKVKSLKYGDFIAFVTNPKVIDKPLNPEQFNYKEYLVKKGITHQVYLKRDTWLGLNYNKSNPIFRFSYCIRNFLLDTMKRLGIQGDEYAVAAAILLGYDDSLPMDLRQQYVATGSMHILCVSGLHVGIIFMVFSYMLIFFNNKKQWQHIVKHLLLLFMIWFYALLAGLAPSILRATIILSFVIFGNIIKRKGIFLNSLSASAFILLCIKPSNIFDVGFLLSYMAVIGIVILQRPILKLFYFKYKIFNKIWEIISVTIAAQIATAPLSIYYFHQFPVYFWLSNLFMTPISFIVITGGMLMLIIFFIPYLNNIIAWIISKMIFVMNFAVSWIESLPKSIIKGLYITNIQFIMLVMIFSALLFFVKLKDKKILYLIMVLFCLFCLLNMKKIVDQRYTKEMTIYSINNMIAIDFISGNDHLLICDSIMIDNQSAISYNIENYWIKLGLYGKGKSICMEENCDEIFVKKKGNLISFDGKLIGLCDGKDLYKEKLKFRIPLDYLIIYGRQRMDLSSLLSVYDFDYLIIDGSVPSYSMDKLAEDARKNELNYYSVRDKGAFILCKN